MRNLKDLVRNDLRRGDLAGSRGESKGDFKEKSPDDVIREIIGKQVAGMSGRDKFHFTIDVSESNGLMEALTAVRKALEEEHKVGIEILPLADDGHTLGVVLTERKEGKE